MRPHPTHDQRETFNELKSHFGDKMISVSGVIDEVVLRAYFGRSGRSKSRIRMSGTGTVGDRTRGFLIPIDGIDFLFYIDRNKVVGISEGDALDLRCKVKRLSPYEGIELNYVRIKQEDDEDKMLEDWKLRGII